jgi:hypothetical protein
MFGESDVKNITQMTKMGLCVLLKIEELKEGHRLRNLANSFTASPKGA